MLDGVRDSKELSAKKREKLCDAIKEIAVSYSVGFAKSQEIDKWGIAPATRMAATRAVMTLDVNPADNKGYGTEAHRKAIKKLKLSAVHRNTFVLKE
jgi:ribonuclease HII